MKKKVFIGLLVFVGILCITGCSFKETSGSFTQITNRITGD